MSRFAYKWHKWLAAGAGLATLLWFASGIVMLLPANLLVKPPAPVDRSEAAPSLKEIRISVPQAIAAIETALGHEVEATSLASKRLLGRTLYQISTRKDGTFLIDAMDGARLKIDAGVVRQIVAAAGANAGTLAEPALVREYDSDYLYGPLPAYKIAVNDGRGTMYFVTAETGEVRSTNTLGRARGFLAGLHTFDFLQTMLGSRGTRVVPLAFAVVGTAMSVFGAWILWLQFRNWRQMRRRAA